MDPKKVEEELRKIVQSLDKGVHLEAALEEEGKWAAVLSKGSHSDRASLSRGIAGRLFEPGRGREGAAQGPRQGDRQAQPHGPEAAVTAGEIIPPVFSSPRRAALARP